MTSVDPHYTTAGGVRMPSQSDTQFRKHPKISRTMSTPCTEDLSWSPHNPSFVRNNIEGRKLLQAEQMKDGESTMIRANHYALNRDMHVTASEDRAHLLTIDEDLPVIEFNGQCHNQNSNGNSLPGYRSVK